MNEKQTGKIVLMIETFYWKYWNNISHFSIFIFSRPQSAWQHKAANYRARYQMRVRWLQKWIISLASFVCFPRQWMKLILKICRNFPVLPILSCLRGMLTQPFVLRILCEISHYEGELQSDIIAFIVSSVV